MEQQITADVHRLELAKAALKRGEPLAAIVQIRAHLSVSGDSGEAQELLGIAHFHAGNHALAVEAFEAATNLDPRRASAHYNYALYLDTAGQLDDSIAELQAALFLRPDYGAALTLQEKLRSKLKDRYGHSDENFAVIESRANPLKQTDSEWAKIKCVSCGSMNFITARSCARCGSYLPEVEEIIPVE
jgi:tetratricopeptide (TPR) repeat protein